MISRDIRGRIAGVLLYVAFLAFHLVYVWRGWNLYDASAKMNSLLITATIIFFLASYFLRREPVLFAQGFKETIFPLFCAGLPLIIYHSVELLRLVPTQNAAYSVLQMLAGLPFLHDPGPHGKCHNSAGDLLTAAFFQHHGGGAPARVHRPLCLREASTVYRRSNCHRGDSHLPVLAGKPVLLRALHRLSGISVYP
jgi:hypothetical protein